MARFRGQSVMVMGTEKGNTTEERIKRNFGMARPEGYRKASRLMDLAGRFGLPVLSFVDTQAPILVAVLKSVAKRKPLLALFVDV